jgi:hypothetical protein
MYFYWQGWQMSVSAMENAPLSRATQMAMERDTAEQRHAR